MDPDQDPSNNQDPNNLWPPNQSQEVQSSTDGYASVSGQQIVFTSGGQVYTQAQSFHNRAGPSYQSNEVVYTPQTFHLHGSGQTEVCIELLQFLFYSILSAITVISRFYIKYQEVGISFNCIGIYV